MYIIVNIMWINLKFLIKNPYGFFNIKVVTPILYLDLLYNKKREMESYFSLKIIICSGAK